MPENTLISAIVPTYNRADAVCSAVESVLVQTYRNIEIIVVDDGSTDDTRAKLRHYEDSIRVIWQRNAGPASARNAGVRAARGQIVTFLDSDDVWLPRKVEKQVSVLLGAGASVSCCVSNMKLCFRGGRVGTSFESAGINPAHSEGIWLNPAEILATRFLMFNQCVAMRREAFEQVGGFDDRLKVLEDYDLALRLSLRGPWAFLREPLVEWKQSEDSLSHLFKDSPTFRSTWSALLGDFALKIPASADCGRARSLALRASDRARRDLRARALSQSTSKVPSLIGRAQLKAQQVSATAFRHSAWYPKMNIVTLNEYQSANRRADELLSPESPVDTAGRECPPPVIVRPEKPF